MATKAKPAKGTKLQRGDGGGSEVFTTIGEVLSVGGPSRSAEAIDATSMDSTAGEVVGSGLVDNGEISVEMLFVASDAQQQGLVTDMQNGTLRNFKYVLNDHATTPSTFSFSAVVTKFDGPGAGGPREAYKASATLKISGAVTASYAP